MFTYLLTFLRCRQQKYCWQSGPAPADSDWWSEDIQKARRCDSCLEVDPFW